ncbi:24111_t:CDS:2, partial [Racocetra persica]
MSVGPVIIRKSLNNCEVSGIHIKAEFDYSFLTNVQGPRSCNKTRPIIDAKTKQNIAQQPVDNKILNVFPRKKVDALKNDSDESLEFRAS